jgi:hypothetical protein
MGGLPLTCGPAACDLKSASRQAPFVSRHSAVGYSGMSSGIGPRDISAAMVNVPTT